MTTANATNSKHHPFGFSQVTGSPSFRSSAVNAVAVIPLLSNHEGSSDTNAQDGVGEHSAKSFRHLWDAISRHNTASSSPSLSSFESSDELLLVVANSSLTRPGDWKYQDTPLKAFHWQEGCQRLHLFDGRPAQSSRLAQDRLLNPSVTRDWIDLCPSRRTAAVIGVLNVRDCKTQADWQRAQEELHQWATQRYSTSPYQVTAHGKMGIERDQPVERLFVFDSFDEDCQHIDLSQTVSKSSVLAFPPSDAAHSEMMDLHLNVVVNDLAVAIFRSLESRIRQSDDIAKAGVATNTRAPISRYVSGGSGDNLKDEEPSGGSTANLSLANMAELVNPESKLAQDATKPSTSAASSATSTPSNPNGTAASSSTTATPVRPSTASNLRRMSGAQSTPPHLLTPLDDYYEWSPSQLSAKDADALKRRDMARREKLAADFSLLAGSPLDSYERYLKAAQLSRSDPDPLWYAMALVGCASAHIAMAEGGGYNVDEYLENNFSLPEDILLVIGGSDQSGVAKQTLPEVVFALCEEALDILSRHKMLASFHAGLLLQLAFYSAESAENHLRCRWGDGPGSFAGGEAPPFRWENGTAAKAASSTSDLKTKDGRDMIELNLMNRVKIICELLQKAVAVPDLDDATRLDVATRSARLCLEGIPGTKWKKTSQAKILLPRKAAYFSAVAAESMTSMNQGISNPVLENVWLLACQLYSKRPNEAFGASDELGSYGWATLRASTLHGLSLQGSTPASLEASEMLLALLEEINPTKGKAVKPRSSVKQIKSATSLDVVSGDSNKAETVNGDETYTEKAMRRVRERFNEATGVSLLLSAQSKWASEPPKVPLEVPLSEQSPNILALGSVWSSIEHRSCANAQKECAERIKALKRTLSASTSLGQGLSVLSPSTYASPPLSISSSWSLKGYDGALDIQVVGRKVEAQVDKGAMATFYNPFEKSGKQKTSIPVAAEEERVITLKLANALAIPLAVRHCQLDFSKDIEEMVNSAPVSFILPPQAVDCPVQFPFTLLSPDKHSLKSTEFQVNGITFTCLNQSFSLALVPLPDNGSSKKLAGVPEPATYSSFPRPKSTSTTSDTDDSSPKIELLPCQPRLEVRKLGSRDTLDLTSNLVLGVTGGELVCTPLFEILNDSGPKGLGILQRLQVVALGVPGGPTEKRIYDTADNAMDDSILSDDEFLRDALTGNPPLLKVRVLPGTDMDVEGLNAVESKCQTLGFQLAVAHNFRERPGTRDINVTFRIRYSGQPTTSKEVWRKVDVRICLKYFKGPRVVSVSFRPDLTGQNPNRQLLAALQERRLKTSNLHPGSESKESKLSSRVGLDTSVHASSPNSVALVSILNESVSDIRLSRTNGSALGSFATKQLQHIVVPKGVKVTIPLTIPRLPRDDDENSYVDVIMKATKMDWKTVATDPSGGNLLARGSMSLKTSTISDLIAGDPSVIPSIFEPPCTIALKVSGTNVGEEFLTTVAPALPIEITVDVSIASWIVRDVVEGTDFTIELFTVNMDKFVSRDHVWCGKVKRKFPMKQKQASHSASVILLGRGTYTISGCVRMSQGGGGDEIW
eukprot:CAMPEP_0168719272 /NCGR_PEP_ID=MMETSP0724-20121128/949_1 /TAXON_ID=265536 /ORGANISM="Amphiprora sp., Strain CCMP467" /LENGTH=1561 /DNA_ID=CAMNT_0008765813 /DNA_START=94 /DNA_END=4776 /DNA_ORIENTATION=+